MINIKNNDGKFLDLILCDCSLANNIKNVINCDPIVPVDLYHPSISLEITGFYDVHDPYQYVQHRYNYSNIDFSVLRKDLCEVNWAELSYLSMTEAVNLFYDKLFEVTNKYCTLSKKISSSFPNWYSNELKQLIKQKKSYHVLFKETNNSFYYEKFSTLRKQCKDLSSQCYRNFIQSTEESIIEDPKKIFKYINTLKNSQSFPKKMKFNNEYSENGQLIANFFAENFSSVYTNDSSSYSCTNYNFENTVDMPHFHIQVETILDKINSLKNNKSMGPDLVSPIILKNCASILAYPLYILFNKSLESGICPEKWKLSYIVPIFKTGDCSDVVNYRPIAIQSAIPKILEGIVADYIALCSSSLIITEQHGFTNKKSTMTNLLIFENYIFKGFEIGCQIDAVYTDFRKAFDKVVLRLLLRKLKALGFSNQIISWLTSFLTDRLLQVKFLSFLSKSYTALSGVPQGSHLGPILFLLFINDIGDHLTLPFLLFADDLKLFYMIKSEFDCINLQRNLNVLNDWCVKNCLNLNYSKCKVISFGKCKNKISFDYSIDNNILQRVSTVNDLGILFDESLSFTDHIEAICKDSMKLLGFIIRSTKDFTNIHTLKLLFVSLVRSKLEYLTVIWSPFYACHILRIERIQHKFLRVINYRLGYSIDQLNYKDLMSSLNLLSLDNRRSQNYAIVLFKLLNYEINCTDILNEINIFVPNYITRYSPFFKINTSTRNYILNTPINRIMKIGNELPIDWNNTSIRAIKRIFNEHVITHS